MLKTYFAVRSAFKNDRGSLPEFTWVVGAAVVTTLVIVAAMVFAPQTAQNFWNAATTWIRNQFGF